MRLTVAFTVAALAVVSAAGRAEATGVAGARGSALASALAASPIVKKISRIAIVLAGERSEAALAARAEVASAFAAAGQQVVVVEVPVAGEPNKALLSKILTDQSSGGAAVVRISTAGGLGALSVVLYDAEGEPVFDFEGEASVQPPPPQVSRSDVGQPAAAPSDLALLPSDAVFYNVIGRPDLAARYKHRESVKTTVRFVGGTVLVVGVLWGLLDLWATTTVNTLTAGPCLLTAGSGSTSSSSSSDVCATQSPSGIPWAVAAVGLGALIIPAFVPSDPLTDAERRALVSGSTDGSVPRPPVDRFKVGLVPAANGAAVFLGGRF